MVVAARCDGVGERCRRVALSIDGSPSIALALRCGWHWYYTRPTRALAPAPVHEVVMRAPFDCPPPKLAVQSLALVADRPVASDAFATAVDAGPPT